MSQLVCSSTGNYDENFTYKEMEIGPDYWFIKNYRLYIQLGWELAIFHVGDIQFDNTKNLKIKFQVPK